MGRQHTCMCADLPCTGLCSRFYKRKKRASTKIKVLFLAPWHFPHRPVGMMG